MAYPYIELDKTPEAKLVAHLAKQCGVQKEAGTPRQELIEAIIEFEETNNMARPVDLLPASMRPTSIVEATAELPAKVELPVRNHPRVRIIIHEEDKPGGDQPVYAHVNGYEVLIQRGKEVAIPRPVYRMLLDAVEEKGSQEKDGSITFRRVPSYNVTFLGEAG